MVNMYILANFTSFHLFLGNLCRQHIQFSRDASTGGKPDLHSEGQWEIILDIALFRIENMTSNTLNENKS